MESSIMMTPWSSFHDHFSFIDTGHPFHPHVQNFRERLIGHPLFQTLGKLGYGGRGSAIRGTIKAIPLSYEEWKLKRLTLSFQFVDRTTPYRFYAVTFSYSAAKQLLTAYPFPYDPCLAKISQVFPAIPKGIQSRAHNHHLHILRYVPRRRLTFRARSDEFQGQPVIGKFLRASALQQAYERLAKVSRAVSQSRVNFSLSVPLSMEAQHGLFYQKNMPGCSLVALLDDVTAPSLLSTLGRLHHTIHQLEVSDLPEWSMDSLVDQLREHACFSAFFQPQHASLLMEVLHLLLSSPPTIPSSDLRFCHGDFLCPQILVEDYCRWSVLDWDSCHYGDPYFEIAMLMASLKYHVSRFRQRFIDDGSAGIDAFEKAVSCYRRGYEEQAGECFDQRRLLWYRLCAEVFFLARLIRRDLYTSRSFSQSIRLLQRLRKQFEIATRKGAKRPFPQYQPHHRPVSSRGPR